MPLGAFLLLLLVRGASSGASAPGASAARHHFLHPPRTPSCAAYSRSTPWPEPGECYANTFFLRFREDSVHSQNGEDGVLLELLRRLGISGGWVCEFGAWDGVHFSNTFALVERGFRAVYIEGDDDLFSQLLLTARRYPGIIPIHAFVDHRPSSASSLDALLAATSIPRDFAVLSIDIDSFDYQVWESIVEYRPKVVIVEIDSSANATEWHHIHSPAAGVVGSAFGPMLALGVAKGYTFVLHTGNMVFVRRELFGQLGVKYETECENFMPIWGGRCDPHALRRAWGIAAGLRRAWGFSPRQPAPT